MSLLGAAVLKTAAGIFMFGSIPVMILYFGIRANIKKMQSNHIRKKIKNG